MGSFALLLLWLPFFLATPACTRATVDEQSEHLQRVMLREGDYLSAPYIDQLKRTRSPLAAGAQYGAHQFIVRKNGNLLELEPIFNFHEGGDPFTLRSDGSLVLPESAYVSNVTISVSDEGSFRIGFSSGNLTFKPTDYVFVRDATAYVAGIVLTGQYKDHRGLNYEFREDGYAVFSDRKFKFEIGLDHVLDNFDYFMEMGPKHIAASVTAFKWDRQKIQLFRTREVDDGGLEEIVDRQPYLSLRTTR
jgi:hypothetical protein